jgi:DMSO/TMAO reductase YedYZ molybdopterin-dependent catalytic subunit
MTVGRISRGFRGKRPDGADASRLPPGQYRVDPDFPVLSAGPTPHTPLDEWTFSIAGEVAEPKTWSWEEFQALPSEEIRTDIHCVTKWSKLDTTWKGISIDTLLEGVEHDATHVLAVRNLGVLPRRVTRSETLSLAGRLLTSTAVAWWNPESARVDRTLGADLGAYESRTGTNSATRQGSADPL